MTNPLANKLAELPAKPGVYLHKDARGKILYVGKAKNLRNRVRSYFQSTAQHDVKTAKLVERVADFDVIITRTEVEALLLEANFIKQHRPPYNVVLRDDKHYAFIKVTWQDPWPTVMTTRRVTGDGARYFGPYTNGAAVKSSLKTLRKIFPYCTSHDLNTPRQGRHACFYYQLGLCPGPCIGAISRSEYRNLLNELSRYLHGQTKQVEADLSRRMQAAAAAQQFERAAAWRDRLHHLTALQQHQQAINPRLGDCDAIGLARDSSQAAVTLLVVRAGRVVARERFNFWGTGEATDQEVLNSFLGQYYQVATNLPDTILIPQEVENAALIGRLLSQRRHRQVMVHHPRRGEKRKLLALATTNAAEYLRELRTRWQHDQQQTATALTELQQQLGLPGVPQRIECFDISTLSGTATVAAMVVFLGGQADQAHYRRFTIKQVSGMDDFAAMREVIRRRFARRGTATSDTSFAALPELIIIDGGKGQLSAASEALAETGLTIPMIGLAKRLEEVVSRQSDGSFTVRQLPADSQGLYLLQRVRDEAHRFAINYNRATRRRHGVRSALDDLPGIGPVRKKQLLKRFGSVAAIRQAELSEIAAVIGQAAGRVVKERL